MNLLLKVYNIQNDVISTSVFDHTKYLHFYNENNGMNNKGYLCIHNSTEFTAIMDENKIASYISEYSFGTYNGQSFTPNFVFESGIYYYWDGESWKTCEEENHDDACLLKGTKITMADGSIKNIEDIKVNDKVLTYNHELGKYVAEDVYYAYKGDDTSKSFTLHFSNDIELSIVGIHDLFEKESKKYVRITDDNVNSFIGKHFYNAKDNRYEELLSVTFNDELIEYYSIYTKHNFNCITNNMLSLPDDVDGLLSFYKFNEDLSVDIDTLNNDIEKYGLLKFEDCEIVDEDVFDICNCKYLNIIAGKDEKVYQYLKDNYYKNK